MSLLATPSAAYGGGSWRKAEDCDGGPEFRVATGKDVDDKVFPRGRYLFCRVNLLADVCTSAKLLILGPASWGR